MPRPASVTCRASTSLKKTRFAFLDIDKAVVQDEHGKLAWSPLALELLGKFPHAARETSSSGQGWHIIAKTSAPASKGCKSAEHNLETYTRDRGVALTFENVSGHAGADETQAFEAARARYFPQKAADDSADWTDSAVWPHGNTDLAKAVDARRLENPVFADLMAGKIDRYKSASEADFAFAKELLRLAGGNCKAVLDYMQQAGLALHRAKWTEGYLRDQTIIKAYRELAVDSTANIKFGGTLPPGASLTPIVQGSPAPAVAQSPTNPIKFNHIKDILARKSRTSWLPGLKDILERLVLALLVAQRNTFKSFIALEWAMRGAVAGCGVVVLSGEGGGLDRRIDAWMRTHGAGVDIGTLKFVALEKPVNLNDAQVLTFVTERIRELGWPLDLFVVDTLSKFTPGLEENDNTENAKFLTMLSDAIRYQFDATVLLVAHAGHDNPGRPRGASTLMANPDAEYVVERREMFVKVTRERLKDSPSLPPLAYQGKPVDLGRVDENMRPITSLAFTLTNAEALPATFKPLGGNQKLAWQALKGILVSHKDAPPCVQPPGQPSVPYLTALETLKVTFEGNVKPSRAATSAIDDLVDKGYLARDAGWLWMTDMDTSGRDIRDTP